MFLLCFSRQQHNRHPCSWSAVKSSASEVPATWEGVGKWMCLLCALGCCSAHQGLLCGARDGLPQSAARIAWACLVSCFVEATWYSVNIFGIHSPPFPEVAQWKQFFVFLYVSHSLAPRTHWAWYFWEGWVEGGLFGWLCLGQILEQEQACVNGGCRLRRAPTFWY